MYTSSSSLPFLKLNLQFQILRLVSWPSIPQMSDSTASHVARICALLARKPSTGMLIPGLLGIPPETAYVLLDQLYAQGHIRPSAMSGAQAQSKRGHRSNSRPGGTAASRVAGDQVIFLGSAVHRLSAQI